MRRPLSRTLPLVALALAACTPTERPQHVFLRGGAWRAQLASPGGALAFGLELQLQPVTTDAGAPDDVVAQQWRATILNGDERITVPVVSVAPVWEGDTRVEELTLDFPHYDSRVVARLDESGRHLSGRWRKLRGPDSFTEMDFAATLLPADAAPTSGVADPGALVGRWAARFASDEAPSVAVLRAAGPQTGPLATPLRGTFLTPTGDYRWLAGTFDERSFELSCFDGAHAFLFRGRRLGDDTLSGEFWSGDRWHDTFTALRDPDAELPDPFAQTAWTGPAGLQSIAFPGLDGRVRNLAEPEFAGRAMILQVFGSWCPNCHDASDELVRLHDKYAGAGLSIVGLAFEHTGDFARDAEQVRRYAARHGVRWPLLIAGVSDKDKATKKLGVLDRVRAFPTTIFLHRDGRVRAIHSGFAGPATGADFLAQRAQFEVLVEELLNEPDPPQPEPAETSEPAAPEVSETPDGPG